MEEKDLEKLIAENEKSIEKSQKALAKLNNIYSVFGHAGIMTVIIAAILLCPIKPDTVINDWLALVKFGAYIGCWGLGTLTVGKLIEELVNVRVEQINGDIATKECLNEEYKKELEKSKSIKENQDLITPEITISESKKLEQASPEFIEEKPVQKNRAPKYSYTLSRSERLKELMKIRDKFMKTITPQQPKHEVSRNLTPSTKKYARTREFRTQAK